MDPHAEQQAKSRNGESRTALLLERTVAACGALLVLASLGFLLYEGVAGDHSPPDLQLTVDAVERSSSGWRVRFTAANVGGQSAAAVRILGTLTPVEGETHEAEVTLDYVPGSSTTTGGLFFPVDPAQGALHLRATGYQDP